MGRKATGQEILAHVFTELGVKTVFGLPGTQNLGLYEALRKSGLRTVVATQELSAMFMAIGQYQATSASVPSSLPVVATVPGPGFTCALTGLAEAKADSVPLLYLVSTNEAKSHFKYQLQELPQMKMVLPVVKKGFEIREVSEIDPILKEAARVALSGEPGPVYIEILDSLFDEVSDISVGANVAVTRSSLSPTASQAVSLIFQASRMVLFVGGGARKYDRQVNALVERLSCPVLSTISGRGVVSDQHPLSFPFDYAFGEGRVIADLIDRADVVLALGCKFSHNGTGGFRLRIPEQKLIHVDASSEVLGANYPGHCLVEMDVGDFLTALTQSEDFGKQNAKNIHWTKEELNILQQRRFEEQQEHLQYVPKVHVEGQEESIPNFFQALRNVLSKDAILVTDSGRHQMLARAFYQVLSPAGLVIPADFQSMGFGLPTAVGAALAGTRPVVALVGDGGFLMSGMEFTSAVREGVKLLVIIFRDYSFSLIRDQQLKRYGRSSSVQLSLPDLEAFSLAFGVNYRTLSFPVEESLTNALSLPGVTILDIELVESKQLATMGYKQLVRNTVRNALGDQWSSRLKALVKPGRR